MGWVPQNREEWKCLVIIAVSFFILSFFYGFRAQEFFSWSWLALYAIFGFVVGLLNKMSLTRFLYISLEGVFVGILPHMLSPYALTALFLLILPISFFLLSAVVGKMIKEKYVHHSTVELSERGWICIIVMFYGMLDLVVFFRSFYWEMYQARSPLLLLFFIAFFVVGFPFGFLLRFEEKKTFRVILKGVLIAHCSFLIFFTLLGEVYFSLFTGLILFFSIIGSYVGEKYRERRSTKE